MRKTEESDGTWELLAEAIAESLQEGDLPQYEPFERYLLHVHFQLYQDLRPFEERFNRGRRVLSKDL